MLETLIFALVLNLVGFLLAYSFQSDKLTDISYSLTFIGIVLFGILNTDMNTVGWVASTVIFIWALRLGTYLFIRINVIGRDKRFDDMRDNFFRFGSFWLLQAITAWVVCLPITLLFASEVTGISSTTATWLGAGIALSGIMIETIADAQKFRFINDKRNRGKWIESGLWRLSRHPNFFGEILVWIGVYVITIEWLARPELYLAALGPATIIFMLLFVSGVPPLEKAAEEKWGKNKDYQQYRNRTSVVIPMLPRKD